MSFFPATLLQLVCLVVAFWACTVLSDPNANRGSDANIHGNQRNVDAHFLDDKKDSKKKGVEGETTSSIVHVFASQSPEHANVVNLIKDGTETSSSRVDTSAHDDYNERGAGKHKVTN